MLCCVHESQRTVYRRSGLPLAEPRAMSPEVLVLGLFSGLRPGTSLAAVLALLKAPSPQRLLLFFTAAGLASSWAIGLVVVGAFHGADVAVGGSTFTAVLDVALGAAALGFAAGLQQGWVQPRRRRRSSPAATAASSRFGQRLRNPSAGVAAAAGVGTHLPGLIYLVALNAIAAERPSPVDAALQVAIYDALWFVVPIASLTLVVVRPSAAGAYLDAATAWARRHEHTIVVSGSFVLGGYLVVKGTASLFT
jgi:Sap, sulfolipid-1-addressing protein